MKKSEWKKHIKQACEGVGTYRPEFDRVIESLADILEKRDEADKQYKESGGNPILEHTNSHGATNLSKNPALQIWADLNTQALAYWRDLGLTPKGLKAIDEDSMKGKKKNSLAEVLANIEKDIS